MKARKIASPHYVYPKYFTSFTSPQEPDQSDP